MNLDENLISELVTRGVVNDTFRRLTADKKARVYRTALGLLAEYGYDGLAVDELCREAGISKGSFFQYFPSKSHLLEFVVLVFDDYLERWVTEVRSADKTVFARDRLRYLYNALVVNTRLHPEEQRFYLYLTTAARHSAVAIEGLDVERHFTDWVTEIVERGEATGEIRGDFDITLTSHVVATVVGALVVRQYAGSGTPRRQLGEYLVSFLFDGIKP